MTDSESDRVRIGDAPFADPQGKTQLFISSTPSVGKNRYNRLLDNDYDTFNDLYQASVSELTEIEGVGRKTALDIKVWVGDKLVDRLDISNEELNNMSSKEIAELYNATEDIADEIKHDYHTDPGIESTHISEK